MVKYFTPEEISIHNFANDCWVIIYNDVYDITSLIQENPGDLIQPLLKNAGLSISHWFNVTNRDIKTFIDPIKNISMPYLPEGRFVHVPPEDPQPWSTISYEKPWWKDEKYIVGKVLKFTIQFSVIQIIICTRSHLKKD